MARRRSKNVAIVPHVYSEDLDQLRQELKRNQTKAFKQALGESLHYWRTKFAKYHFKKNAYGRYNHPKAWYADTQAKSSEDDVNLTINGHTLTPPYSIKKYKMARHNYDPENARPLVFSGDMRKDVLVGPFQVKGTAKSVQGSFKGKDIKWGALSRNDAKLGRHLFMINANEKRHLVSMIRNKFLPKYINRVERGLHVPSKLNWTERGASYSS